MRSCSLTVLLSASTSAGALYLRRPRLIACPPPVFTPQRIHGIRPSIPEIRPVLLNQLPRPHGPPWRDLGTTTAYCSMAAVGFGYFLPSQVLFSLWAFFVIIRLQNIAFSAFGSPLEAMPLYPTSIWNGYQVAGAYLVLVGYMTRSALPHLRGLWRAALHGREHAPELMTPAPPSPRASSFSASPPPSSSLRTGSRCLACRGGWPCSRLSSSCWSSAS